MGQLPLKVTSNKVHGFNDTQNMMRKKGWTVKNSTTGLGYSSKLTLCLLINRPTDKHEQGKPKTRKESLVTHSRPMGVVMWRYPTKREIVFIGRTRPEEPHFGKQPQEGQLLSEDVVSAPPGLEEDVKVTVDELKEVNLGTDNKPRPSYVSALLMPEEEVKYVTLLKGFKDVFPWTYKKNAWTRPKGGSPSPGSEGKHKTCKASTMKVPPRVGTFDRSRG
ncbi:hypothetical protein LIER_26415 [Lithospermum erythrorhizon]|uniref:Uncharacterized protein n=1 Tax=Lithospermum erythrorhizon TaxID=34254 RepID=A0AAV3RBA3_LITER